MIDRSQFISASLVLRLGNAVVNYRNKKMQTLGLTSAQSDAIRSILKSPGITASKLKEQLGLCQSTIAGIIERLKAKGLIEKGTDNSDARKAILIPTEAGLQLDNMLKETAIETQKFITDGMSEAEVAELNRLLALALENMKGSN